MAVRHFVGFMVTSDKPFEAGKIFRHGRIVFQRTRQPTRWEEYQFRSPEPLRGERQPFISGYYEYVVLCRRSGPRVLVMSEAGAVVESVLRTENTARRDDAPLRNVGIDVNSLVHQMTLQPGGSYVLTRVDARLPGYGEELKSVTFYGDDVAEAQIFREYSDYMHCYACGIRDLASRFEVVRLGHRGRVAFAFTGWHMIVDVERALAFAKDYIK